MGLLHIAVLIKEGPQHDPVSCRGRGLADAWLDHRVCRLDGGTLNGPEEQVPWVD